eukprot:COSAG04_NODE_8407_length_980_cov_1.959137_2_plen_91_part_00
MPWLSSRGVQLTSVLCCEQKQIHSEISSNVGGALAEIETMRQEAEEFAEAERMKQAENLFRRAMGKMQNAVAASCFEVRAHVPSNRHICI